jgi:hypothetical protein
MEGLVFLAVLLFGFGGGVVYKGEKIKLENKKPAITQEKQEKK